MFLTRHSIWCYVCLAHFEHYTYIYFSYDFLLQSWGLNLGLAHANQTPPHLQTVDAAFTEIDTIIILLLKKRKVS